MTEDASTPDAQRATSVVVGGGSSEAGFTLVELMITVSIVGVLAMIAVVGYRSIVSTSKVAEAKHMVQAIRVAQESYHAEVGAYANISPALATKLADEGNAYPLLVSGVSFHGQQKIGWGGSCGSACNAGTSWQMLPVHTDGPVLFGYATVAGPAGGDPSAPLSGTGISGATNNSPNDWYEISAMGDLNGDGSVYSSVISLSFTNELYVFNEGQ